MGYEIEPQRAYATADQLDNVSMGLRAAVETLQARVNDYRQANAGESIEAYAEVQKNWHTGSDQVEKGNVQATHALRTIVGNYLRADRNGAGLFS